jgi:cyanophycinase-like exopeptidase
MMKIWKTNDIDAVLKTRALGGLVMTGTSAGAIASFTWGHSDSLSYRVSEGEPWDYIAVEGLGLLRGAVTPHYNTAPTGIPRSELFKKMFRQEKDRYGTTYGFGLDNLAGIEVSGGILRPISAVEDAGVTILDGRTDEISQHRLAKDETLALQTLVA